MVAIAIPAMTAIATVIVAVTSAVTRARLLGLGPGHGL
jgi:hypothetical protein